jgi:two-component sensor histidine kinase
MLATIQAIMGSTARASATIKEFQDAFTGRIASLANTHSTLANNALQNASFRELLCNQLDPYDDGSGKRIALTGPHVEIDSTIAIPLGMALHELTTNAAKHGALSVLGGAIEVTWSVVDEAERALRFEWVEKNGPIVTAPARRGFGSQLLERVLTHQIGADAKVHYLPHGVRAQVRVPLKNPSANLLDTV